MGYDTDIHEKKVALVLRGQVRVQDQRHLLRMLKVITLQGPEKEVGRN